jgi:hypothetical protein
MADTFVLFVDMLGFADMVEKDPDAANRLTATFLLTPEDDPLTHGLVEMSKGLLGKRFAAFHRTVEGCVRRFVQDGVASITFSDSAFIQMDDLVLLAHCARDLMAELITKRVPARVGIGVGTFKALRFMSDTSGKANLQASQFLGTAVIRAYRAEHCGEASMTVLLHPSLEQPLKDARVPLVELETRFPHAFAQLNYLKLQPKDPNGNTFQPMKTNYDVLRSRVEDMAKVADEKMMHYYTNTLTALQRMEDEIHSD